MIVDVCVCVLVVQTCVSDLKRASVESVAARNERADVSQQLSVSKLMLSDLQDALHVNVCPYGCDCNIGIVAFL